MSQDYATRLLEKLGFPASRYVRGRASIADMFRPGKRCGIYLLHCSNAEYYAGQAADVTRRYVQHRKTHADIERISFKRVRRDRLDIEERRVIWALEEAGIYLRNIALTSIPHGASDFDLIMSPEEQERWLVDPHHREVGVAAGIAAEPFVLTTLPASGMGWSEGHGPPTILTPAYDVVGAHKPVHL